MWLFLHRPFEIWPWLGTLRIERVYMICVLVAWLTIAQKQLTENKINFAVGLIALAMIVSTVMSPYTNPMDSVIFQNWFKYVVFYVLVVTSIQKESDLKIVVTALIVCFFLYLLHSYWEYLHGRHNFAMGTVRMIGIDSTMNDPNAFGASIVIIMPMLLPLLALIRKKWQYLFILAYFLLSIRCVQLTGSRTAFIVLGTTMLIAAMISRRRMVYLPIILLGAAVVWATAGDNLRDRYRSIFDKSINESATESAEGRTQGFWDGLENWQSSPIWGVGPDCHGIARGTGFLSHILYGQIPGELGTLGVLGYLALIACFLLNHIEISQAYREMNRLGRGREALYCYRVSLAVIAGLFLLLFFGLGGHNGYRYSWVWYAAFQAVAVSIMNENLLKAKHRPGTDLRPTAP